MPTNKKLTGMYTVVLDNENGNIGSNTYNRVLVAYDFKDDYTGQWLELFYKDGTDEPFIGHGGNAGACPLSRIGSTCSLVAEPAVHIATIRK